MVVCAANRCYSTPMRPLRGAWAGATAGEKLVRWPTRATLGWLGGFFRFKVKSAVKSAKMRSIALKGKTYTTLFFQRYIENWV